MERVFYGVVWLGLAVGYGVTWPMRVAKRLRFRRALRRLGLSIVENGLIVLGPRQVGHALAPRCPFHDAPWSTHSNDGLRRCIDRWERERA